MGDKERREGKGRGGRGRGDNTSSGECGIPRCAARRVDCSAHPACQYQPPPARLAILLEDPAQNINKGTREKEIKGVRRRERGEGRGERGG